MGTIPTPKKEAWLWERPHCTCHYFYQYYLCGCPDLASPRGDDSSSTIHRPSLQRCPMHYQPTIDRLMHHIYGFRHNPNPPLDGVFRVLPFPCHRHLMESRVFLPPDALRKRRRQLMNPKWNPISAARRNRNKHILQLYQDQGSSWESKKRARDDDDEGIRLKRARKRRHVAEAEEVAQVADFQRTISIMTGARSPGLFPSQSIQRPLSASPPGSSLRVSALDGGDNDYSPDTLSEAGSSTSSDAPTSVGSPGRVPSTASSPPPPPGIFSAAPSDSESVTSWPSRTTASQQRVIRPARAPLGPSRLQYQLSLPRFPSQQETPPDWESSPTPESTDPSPLPPLQNPPSQELPPSQQTPLFQQPLPSPPPSTTSFSSSSTTTPFLDWDPTPKHFSSLDWLLEEQSLDLSTLDDHRSLPYLPPPPPPPQPLSELLAARAKYPDGKLPPVKHHPVYETYAHNGYHKGAYKMDYDVLTQARVANWWAADPEGKAARAVGEVFGKGGLGWEYGFWLSME